jgi:hypothetical protein
MLNCGNVSGGWFRMCFRLLPYFFCFACWAVQFAPLAAKFPPLVSSARFNQLNERTELDGPVSGSGSGWLIELGCRRSECRSTLARRLGIQEDHVRLMVAA